MLCNTLSNLPPHPQRRCSSWATLLTLLSRSLGKGAIVGLRTACTLTSSCASLTGTLRRCVECIATDRLSIKLIVHVHWHHYHFTCAVQYLYHVKKRNGLPVHRSLKPRPRHGRARPTPLPTSLLTTSSKCAAVSGTPPSFSPSVSRRISRQSFLLHLGMPCRKLAGVPSLLRSTSPTLPRFQAAVPHGGVQLVAV